jgi:2-polyprenyl-3-methyl-5-hydroxy-6-metoxy-1,4-benzoquinol methylase
MELSAKLKENYDDYYDAADAEWRRIGALDKAENIVSLCSGIPRGTILEIGAGDGAILQRLAELGFGDKLYAVEISKSGVEAIQLRGIPGLAEARLFDGYRLPYDDATFDVAILSHVVEHVEFPRQLLYEASRVARYVFIEVPLEDMSRLPEDYVFDKVGHINQYSRRTIRWLAQSSGLRVVRQVVSNPSRRTYRFASGSKGLVNYYVKQILLAVVPGFAQRHFTYHCSLLCERTPMWASAGPPHRASQSPSGTN